VLKIINNAVSERPPSIHAQHPSSANAGETVELAAHLANPDIAAVSYQWDFGDGVILHGAEVSHAYTHTGNYTVKLTAIGLDGLKGEDTFHFPVTGSVSTRFIPGENRRYASN
jgi:chitodextrinase